MSFENSLVEAAGVAPASEIVVSQKTPRSVRSVGFRSGNCLRERTHDEKEGADG